MRSPPGEIYPVQIFIKYASMKKNERSIDNHLGCSGEFGRYIGAKVSQQFQFVHGNFNFTHGNFNLLNSNFKSRYLKSILAYFSMAILLFRKCIKYVGVVMIDEFLSWKYHISFVCSFNLYLKTLE